MSKNVLLIFTRNPVYGKVKTRLAVTVGNDKALEIYKQLVKHTYSVAQKIHADKIIFYDGPIAGYDFWPNHYQKQIQHGVALGERMMNAFRFAFEKKYQQVVLIGTDCAELNVSVINKAFKQLHKYHVVVGPAADGGYYLLGMKKMDQQIFKGIQWSTSTVLVDTLQRCKENNLSYFLLDVLHDIDEEKDLIYMNKIL